MNHILSLCIKYKCKKTSPQNFFRLKNFFFFFFLFIFFFFINETKRKIFFFLSNETKVIFFIK